MKTIAILENKTLLLKNTLSYTLDLEKDNINFVDIQINKMDTYIQTHGANRIGPIIQYSDFEQQENGQVNFLIKFMVQSDSFIADVDSSYEMNEISRVTNCLYARYIGPEDTIKFAYDKLGVYAFENEIDLKGNSYTIYVDRNQDDESIVADVFMPLKDN